MADKILEFLTNLLKVGKEQLFSKSGLLRDKVPIKPVLGLTGLGVLFMAVRPLLSNSSASEQQIESTISKNDDEEIDDENNVQKTLYLMREKEKQLRREEAAKRKS